MQVLDYSAGFPGAAAIAADGYGGAVRYIGFPNNRKCTTAEELADFTEHELGMALVYEHTAGDWRAGFDGGQAAARIARDHADAIGFPEDRPIYFAVDQDVVHEHEFVAAMEYLRGASDVLGVENVGVYGEHDVVARAADEGVATWFWQCRAWSGTPVRYFDGRHLYQQASPQPHVGGVQCDVNEVLTDDWGQHDAEREEVNEEHERIREAIELLQQIVGDGEEEEEEEESDEPDEEAFDGAITHSEAKVVDALRDLATGAADVSVLAKALAPLLPTGLTAEEIADALSAELAA
ncbi:DUF1906 domain-containing protein [Lentzea tibetensis]|uniref:DUF1906 domain-containing protein n=1 Tax=Lentzea tibetensis TaxID=2591470 RepID=A0A563EVT5_9PSEU|nr:glycoside hydrolase domain-containing protein [Lentzea tibetensis]TWP51827.1 DUF1906 domain-containing protein [Lentzea tibetensis]